jgi:hypothetical protein
MKTELELVGFVSLGVWVWFWIIVLLIQALRGLTAFQTQF